ncbi:tyrosine-protein phosphatase [Paenibacillus protaetiae]|uniref:Tyrosine-protein phosphatase n=1 Tax=Paenibacillus protaetiae TaxID=2509456 RepID=A0A4P6ET65_9BACL|nr:tyrosine-protein phosphatase [Paenibacillus protaetiae]QAY65223.1 tyrosine-protein phosphatase [Paenibacillus protaetiae]
MMKKSILAGTALFLTIAPFAAGAANAASPAPAPAAHAIAKSVKQGSFVSASVERKADGKLVIHWHTDADLGAAKVYWSTNPDGGWKELVRTYTNYGGYVTEDPNPGSRVYFKVKGGNGAEIKTAERKLPLKGTTNFRDLGGYQTSDGRTVKWGKLFRADELAGLTPDDIAYLQKSGLKTDVDYRTDAEIAAKPDPAIPGVTYVKDQVFQDTGSGTDIMAVLAAGQFDQLGKPGAMLVDANRQMVDHPDAYVKLFDLMLDPNTSALVQHCTAGKDRTGLGSALMLLALGVPKQTVVDDFLLTNTYRADYNKAAVDVMVKQFNVTDPTAVDVIQAMMDVRPEYIYAAFDEMQKNYGSIAGFLEKGLGLTKAEQAKLQQMYLE